MTDMTNKAMTLERAKEIVDRMCESESVPPSPNPMCDAVCKLVDADDCYALRDWFKEHLSAQRDTTNKAMTYEAALHTIRAKFRSGNSVGVERAIVTTEEWEAIDAHLAAQREGEAVAVRFITPDGSVYGQGWKNYTNQKLQVWMISDGWKMELAYSYPPHPRVDVTDIEKFVPNWAEFWLSRGNEKASHDYNAFLLAYEYARAALEDALSEKGHG